MHTVRRSWWIGGLAIAALVVVILAPLASGDPDGLMWVAGEHGFLESGRDALYSIIPGYAFPGVDDPALSKILAGLVGVVILGPTLASAAVPVIGWPLAAARGTTGRLARENARRNPRRTAGTAAALMIGVAVVTSQLAARVRAQADLAQKSSGQNAALANFARALGGLSTEEELGQTLCAEVSRMS